MDRVCEACSTRLGSDFCPDCGLETVEIVTCAGCGAAYDVGEDPDVCEECGEEM